MTRFGVTVWSPSRTGLTPAMMASSVGSTSPYPRHATESSPRRAESFRSSRGHTSMATVVMKGDSHAIRHPAGRTIPGLRAARSRGQAAQALRAAQYTDPRHDPMIPHVLVLVPGLEVFRVYVGYWYWGRPSNDDLRRDLRELTQRIRPDWDISGTALREAWARGERDRFW